MDRPRPGIVCRKIRIHLPSAGTPTPRGYTPSGCLRLDRDVCGTARRNERRHLTWCASHSVHQVSRVLVRRLDLASWPVQCDVRESAVRRGAMPVLLARWDQDHVAGMYFDLTSLGRDHAGATCDQ